MCDIAACCSVLCRLVRALHQGAPCCATTHTPHPHTAAQAPATSSSCATDTSSGRAGTLDNQHSNTQPPAATMDTVHPVHLLVGATCDMHMMQLLLDQVAQQQSSSSAGGGAAGSNAAGESLQQFRAQHLLDAVVSSQCWSCSWDGTDAFWGAELHSCMWHTS